MDIWEPVAIDGSRMEVSIGAHESSELTLRCCKNSSEVAACGPSKLARSTLSTIPELELRFWFSFSFSFWKRCGWMVSNEWFFYSKMYLLDPSLKRNDIDCKVQEAKRFWLASEVSFASKKIIKSKWMPREINWRDYAPFPPDLTK